LLRIAYLDSISESLHVNADNFPQLEANSQRHHQISEETMGPSTSAHTGTTNRTFGTLRKNVILLLCWLGLVAYSIVYNSYCSMHAYVHADQEYSPYITATLQLPQEDLQQTKTAPQQEQQQQHQEASETDTDSMTDPALNLVESSRNTSSVVPVPVSKEQEQYWRDLFRSAIILALQLLPSKTPCAEVVGSL
jgi:hypothetical protein